MNVVAVAGVVVGVFLLACLVMFAIGRIVATAVGAIPRLRTIAGKYLLNIRLVPVGLAVIVGHGIVTWVVFGIETEILEAWPILTALLKSSSELVIAVGVIAAGARGFRPGVQTLIADEIAVPAAIRRRHRLVGIGVLGAFLFVYELTLVPGGPLVGYHAIVSGSVLLLGVYWPLTISARVAPGEDWTECRPPTDAERARIEHCFERFGRSPGRILVSSEPADVSVLIAGKGASKTLCLTQPFLERIDDDSLAIAVAEADERARRGYLRLSAWIVTLGVVELLLIGYWLLGGITAPTAVAAVLVASLLLAGTARRKATVVAAADRFATDQFGAEQVWQTYEAVGDDLQSISYVVNPRLFYELPGFPMEPEMDERIRRLQESVGDTTTEDGESRDPPPAGQQPATEPTSEASGTESSPPPTEPPRAGGSDDPSPDEGAQWPATRRRVLAASALLVVGLVLALAIPYVGGDLSAYAGNPTVDEFDPAERPGVAAADTDVVDLDDRVANGSADFREAVRTAATTGEYEATGEAVPDELLWLADSERFPTPEYVVYDGRYYEWFGYAGSVGPSVTVELDSLTVEAAMDEIATPYAETAPETREQIDGEAGRWGVAGVVVRNGTYYAVSRPFWDRVGQSPTGFTKQIMGAAASTLLVPIGVAFAVVGTWLLVRLRRRRPTAVGRVHAAVLAVVAGVVAGGLALGGSSPQFVGYYVSMAMGVVGLVVAGDRIRRGRWLRVVAIGFGVPIAVVVASVATGWGFGLILGIPGLMTAALVAWPLLGYGYYMGREPTGNATAAPDSEGCRGT